MTTRDNLHLLLSNQRFNKRISWLLPLIALLLAGMACNFPKLRTPEKALPAAESSSPSSGSPLPSLQESSALAQADSRSYATEVILHWQGSLPDDPLGCHNLDVTVDHQAHYGPCSGEAQTAPFNPPQWDEMLLRTASFELSTPEAKLTFRGQGNTGGPAWERAIARWAQEVYASMYTGHACAACSTVFNWSFGEAPGASGTGTCKNLWVTDYGYAYLGAVPCQGGQAEILAQGWLETGEWAQLDSWLTGRSEVHLGETGASYLLGNGRQAMSAEELTHLAAWSQQVKDRLLSTDQ